MIQSQYAFNNISQKKSSINYKEKLISWGNLNMSQEFINLNKVLTQLNLMDRSAFKKITHLFNSLKLYKMSCKIPKVNIS